MALLENGWAVALPKFLKGVREKAYLAAEERARQAGKGLWAAS